MRAEKVEDDVCCEIVSVGKLANTDKVIVDYHFGIINSNELYCIATVKRSRRK